jgi:hypothetical protein
MNQEISAISIAIIRGEFIDRLVDLHLSHRRECR